LVTIFLLVLDFGNKGEREREGGGRAIVKEKHKGERERVCERGKRGEKERDS
jgi:hypothetical protein